jgi:hypothetical protein
MLKFKNSANGRLPFKYKEVKAYFKENGCKLLSKEYINTSTKLKFICKCGRRSRRSLVSFNISHCCRICGKKLTRKKIYDRDNYTCQCCKGSISGTLNAHHIHNYSNNKDLRFILKNGITFCKSCHYSFHRIYGYKNNDSKQLKEYISLMKYCKQKIQPLPI